MFFKYKDLKKKLLKNVIISAHFFPYRIHVFLARNFFAIKPRRANALDRKNSVWSKIFLNGKTAWKCPFDTYEYYIANIT